MYSFTYKSGKSGRSITVETPLINADLCPQEGQEYTLEMLIELAKQLAGVWGNAAIACWLISNRCTAIKNGETEHLLDKPADTPGADDESIKAKIRDYVPGEGHTGSTPEEKVEKYIISQVHKAVDAGFIASVDKFLSMSPEKQEKARTAMLAKAPKNIKEALAAIKK